MNKPGSSPQLKKFYSQAFETKYMQKKTEVYR